MLLLSLPRQAEHSVASASRSEAEQLPNVQTDEEESRPLSVSAIENGSSCLIRSCSNGR